MLEGWTALGFMAAHSKRARLGLMVGGIHYRNAGALGQGHDDARRPVRRARLARHRRGLEPGGVARASASRSRRSASASRCSRRRSGSPTRCGRASAASEARIRRAATSRRRACSTRPSRSRGRGSPIMVGGGGEQKTLRLVAQYADACNVFGAPEVDRPQVRGPATSTARRSGATRDEIERSTLQNVRLGPAARPARSRRQQIVDRFGELGRRRRPARDLRAQATSTSRPSMEVARARRHPGTPRDQLTYRARRRRADDAAPTRARRYPQGVSLYRV